MNNGISEASAAQLCDLVLKSKCPLAQFHFFNNMSGPGGAKAIAAMLQDPQLRNLTDLRFSGTRAQAEGTLAVTNAIATGCGPALTKLDLNDNTFLKAGAQSLKNALVTRGAYAYMPEMH
jgi:Ran GTPase-activating protein (RanGAP) involved in mRNA processing and transport